MKMHFFQVQPGERQLSALPQWLWGQSLQRQWRDFLFLPWDIRKLQKLRVIFQQLWAESVHEWSRTQWCCPSSLWRWARSSSHVHIVSAYASFFFLKLCISSDQAHVHQMSAPLKYSIPHAVVSFGPAGQLIRVTTGLSAQENVSLLEIHSLEVGSQSSCLKKATDFHGGYY